MTAQRTKDWNEFAAKVADHIENYTVPQYGDAPNDNVEVWSAQDCIAQIQKYAARFGNNQRTGQEELDLMKIAHYAQLAMGKMTQGPFDRDTAIEYLQAGKAVRRVNSMDVVVLAVIGGNALSRFVNANYGTGDDEVNLPIPNQFLLSRPSGGVGFDSMLPSAFEGWVLASDDEVREIILRNTQQVEVHHDPR
jgi:hypothetical protein|nr:MAG TPA: hypothetical protein [Caudoviricetes sp.]